MIWEADFAKKIFYKVSHFKIKYITTRQILIWKFYNASDFGLKKIQRVRFLNKNFTTRQILNKKINNVLVFKLKIFHLFQS